MQLQLEDLVSLGKEFLIGGLMLRTEDLVLIGRIASLRNDKRVKDVAFMPEGIVDQERTYEGGSLHYLTYVILSKPHTPSGDSEAILTNAGISIPEDNQYLSNGIAVKLNLKPGARRFDFYLNEDRDQPGFYRVIFGENAED